MPPLLMVSALAFFFVEMAGLWSWTCPLSPFAVLSLALAFLPEQKPPPLGVVLDAMGGLVVVRSAIPLAIISVCMAANLLHGALIAVSTHCWRICIAGGMIWLVAALRHAMNAYADCKRIGIMKQRIQSLVTDDALNTVTAAQQTLPLMTRIWTLLFPHNTFGVVRFPLPGGPAFDEWPHFGTLADPPVLIYIHGGAWKKGSSRIHASNPFLHRMCMRGWRVYSLNYRKERWPEHLNDCQLALTKIREAVGPAAKIVISGSSAGGHLAALLAATWSEGAGNSNPTGQEQLRAVILFYPALDPADALEQFVPLPFGLGSSMRQFWKRSMLKGGNEASWRSSLPATAITSSFPACFIVHGELDSLVPIEQSSTFLTKLQQCRPNLSDALLEVPFAGHSLELRGGVFLHTMLDGVVAWLLAVEQGLM
jgi:acetyl esterase/lipase